ncbi:phospho-N-acetylmuramoyl-pentapeptide-transferase [Anaeromicropila populeti]|uniref:Phospho-N-acetylmuramoyl-pentapeptide-transferase n=1 Tax=Anaeromicropila populeti TaxID=37658 RepID=A0A1I6KXG7_9FIRM|nr:phospho-N-acetylmuramoyl-pentapeptide-transferase [Anaeromicropila populeti]SFR95708.1 Phospho-N-acetylmuramoyl-pentapeptide-transferase [Anaeromicropila populeti]
MEFKILLPVLISFAISVVLSPIFIPFLKKLKFGQYIRDEGPQSHLKKSGTPTMGGLIILCSIVLTSLLFVNENKEIIPILFVTLGFGLIGFLDDYIKVVMKRSLGLRAWQKMFGEIMITVVFCYYIINHTEFGTETLIPFYGMITMPDVLFIVVLFIAVLGTVNGVNFTDGLDGLASSVTVCVATFFTAVAIGTSSGISPITCSVVGSLLGFLIYNVYPARVFMGDTGSLALGGFVVAAAYMLKMPFFIVIVGGIYFVEILSVMMQVSYFKLTKGKRIFKMAPIHHHFELSGWSETRVVAVFSIITGLLCLVAYTAM